MGQGQEMDWLYWDRESKWTGYTRKEIVIGLVILGPECDL